MSLSDLGGAMVGVGGVGLICAIVGVDLSPVIQPANLLLLGFALYRINKLEKDVSELRDDFTQLLLQFRLGGDPARGRGE